MILSFLISIILAIITLATQEWLLLIPSLILFLIGRIFWKKWNKKEKAKQEEYRTKRQSKKRKEAKESHQKFMEDYE